VSDPVKATELGSRHRTVAVWCALIVLSMVGAAYAAVPLYSMFCQVTGFAGTPQRTKTPSSVVLDRSITIRFDANVGAGLAWRFEPVQKSMDVRLGENALAFYRATNVSDHPTVGTATYNVTPEQSGVFFNKLECFCFKEQRLEPGESVEMPVSFFIDPQMVDDRDGRNVKLIVLSYTFYPVAPQRDQTVQRRTPAG
jgi:cytochrome c oxidase assembly protein subunit 11